MKDNPSNIDEAVRIIQAIGSTWPFILVVFLIIIVLVKWKTIWMSLGSFSIIKVKGAGAEIELSKNKNDQDKDIKTAENPIIQEDKNEEQVQPKEDLFNVYLEYSNKDYKKGNEIFKKIQKLAKTENERTINELINFRYKFMSGQANAQIELIEYSKSIDASEFKAKTKAIYFIAQNYKFSSDFELAISQIDCLDISKLGDSDYLDLIILKSECLVGIGNHDDGTDLLISSLTRINESENRYRIFKQLASIYHGKKNHFLRALALEMALTLKPNDSDSQFNLAYACSENKDLISTIFHYHKLLKFSPDDSYGLNNYGVTLGKLELPISSIKSYRKSFSNKNSLAASNLAYLYMDAGFYDEAKSMIEDGEKMEDVSKNLSSAKTRLNDILENENETKDEYLQIGSKKRDFNTKMAQLCFLKKTDLNEYVGIYILYSHILAEFSITEFGYSMEWKSRDSNNRELNHSLKGSFINGLIGEAYYKKPHFITMPGGMLSRSEENKAFLSHDEFMGNFYVSDNTFYFLLFMKDSKTNNIELKMIKKIKH